MPLVQLLKADGLSWSDREHIADAIATAHRQHSSMAVENRKLNAAQAGAALQGGQA